MPEDRFGDLDARERRSAAERLADLDDRRAPEEDAPSDAPKAPPPARTGTRYGWVVAVAVFVLIAGAVITALPNTGRGIEGPEPGSTLPDFAAASVEGGSEDGPNIRQKDGEFNEQSETPACDVTDPDAVNICELRDRPVVITFVAQGCEQALEVVDEVRADFPKVNFVGVISGDDRDGLTDVLSENDWGYPVALDPDLLVFNLYRVADCPTTVTAEAGGEVVETRNGTLTANELRQLVERTARRSDTPG